MTKIISENNNTCLVNDFIFACSVFDKNHPLVTFDVVICTGYTIFANALNL